MDILVPRKTINAEALAAEMTAAIGPAWQGWSARKADPDHYILYVPDATQQATIDAVLAVYAAHDSGVLTPRQQEEAATLAAYTALQTADYKAVKTAIESATQLSQLKPILLEMLELQWKAAKAAGIVPKVTGPNEG